MQQGGRDREFYEEFNQGFDQGFDKGFDKGFDQGFDKGFDQGFDKGFDEEFDQGFDEEFDEGFEGDLESRGVVPKEKEEEEDEPRQSSCKGAALTVMNGVFALSFAVQNTSLNVNGIVQAIIEWGQDKPFEKPLIISVTAVGFAVLFPTNVRSYFRLLQEFVGISGQPTLSDCWESLSGLERAKYVLGAWVSIVKMVGGAFSTYALAGKISEDAALATTFITSPGNLGCNIVVFMRPKPVLPYMIGNQELTVANLETRGILGNKKRVEKLLGRSTLYVRSRMSTRAAIGVEIVTLSYAILNANLYGDSFFTIGKTFGLVAPNQPPLTSWYFWLVSGVVSAPCLIGNYNGYHPLIEDLFRYSGGGDQNNFSALKKGCGCNFKESFWKSMGMGAATVKTAASTVALIKIGIDVLEATSGWVKGLIIGGGVLGGGMVGIANLSIFNQKKRDNIRLLSDPIEDVEFDILNAGQSNARQPLNDGI